MLTLREEVANAISHGLGLLAAIFAFPYLARAGNDLLAKTSNTVFALTIVLLYAASTLYHAMPIGSKIKDLFENFDYAGIFLLIAGTYTAVCAGLLRNLMGFLLLFAIWSLAAVGIRKVIFYPNRNPPLWLYIIMGWMALFAIKQMYFLLPGRTMGLIIGGGVVYTAGLAFYLSTWMRYHHLYWHVFVLLGTLLHSLAVLTYQ